MASKLPTIVISDNEISNTKVEKTCTVPKKIADELAQICNDRQKYKQLYHKACDYVEVLATYIQYPENAASSTNIASTRMEATSAQHVNFNSLVNSVQQPMTTSISFP